MLNQLSQIVFKTVACSELIFSFVISHILTFNAAAVEDRKIGLIEFSVPALPTWPTCVHENIFDMHVRDSCINISKTESQKLILHLYRWTHQSIQRHNAIVKGVVHPKMKLHSLSNHCSVIRGDFWRCWVHKTLSVAAKIQCSWHKGHSLDI